MQDVESVEARWFLGSDDARLEVLEAWFADVASEGSGRQDVYYFDSQLPELNIKQRWSGSTNAKLEVKYCVGQLGITNFAPKLSGRLERWRKVSLPGSGGAVLQHQRCVNVEKRRRLLLFEWDGAVVRRRTPAERLTRGCGVELTKIRADRDGVERNAWSFCLEAFGPTPVSHAALEQSLLALTTRGPELNLDAEESHNYVSWLIREFGPDAVR